jgi:hypothetical protein
MLDVYAIIGSFKLLTKRNYKMFYNDHRFASSRALKGWHHADTDSVFPSKRWYPLIRLQCLTSQKTTIQKCTIWNKYAVEYTNPDT